MTWLRPTCVLLTTQRAMMHSLLSSSCLPKATANSVFFISLSITGRASGGQLLSSEECRRRAKEAEELARKSSDFGAQRAYEEIARLWRDMADRAERNKW